MTFISMLEPVGDGPTVAVKDLIDIEGTITTAGSRAVEALAVPAERDASLLAGIRAADCRIIGKVNLHELAAGTSGINEHFGTPENPFGASLIPGGSSSGSAVAVATGEAEVALGSDTGGSIRIPSAFCGVTGLKTTFGRIGLEGVRALAPSLDTVGPMARDVAGVALGMALLEPGFVPADSPASVIGRLRLPDVPCDPVVDDAVDQALQAAGFEVVDISLPLWSQASTRALQLLLAEAVEVNRQLLEDQRLNALLGEVVRSRLTAAANDISSDDVDQARALQVMWKNELDAVFSRVQALALPSVNQFPPTIEEAAGRIYNTFTIPFNYAGTPSLTLPIAAGPIPASMQLVGPRGSEELLVRTGADIEAAAGRTWAD